MNSAWRVCLAFARHLSRETASMTKFKAPTKLAAALILAALATASGAYADRLETACKQDYLSFCGEHPAGSTGMRRCMEANGKNLSKRCINALVDAGEIPRKYKR